jgi:hypothetical protein
LAKRFTRKAQFSRISSGSPDALRLEAKRLAMLDMGEASRRLLIIRPTISRFMPVLPSSVCRPASMPLRARLAAMTPALAARPAWSGFVMVPNCDMKPPAMLVAIESAYAAFSASRRSSRAQAAARTDRAHGRRRVPAAVAMRRVQALADPAEDLQPGDIGIEARLTGGAFLLGDGQDRWREHGGGMRLGRIEIVVEIERVRGGAVDQRRPRRRKGRAHADGRAGAGAPVLHRFIH